MRERANKIEQLKQQLRTYEELHLRIALDEDGTYQQSSSPSVLPPNKQGGVEGWCTPQHPTPPAAPNDSQFGRVQQPVCPAPMEQQPVNSPRPVTPQRMECWTLINSQKSV